MSSISLQTKPVTITLTDHIPVAHQVEYEGLVAELHQLFQQQPDFVSVDVIRHTRLHLMEYTVVLRVDSDQSFSKWKKDPKIKVILEKIYAVAGEAEHSAKALGLEIWVDHKAGSEPVMPPVWKRVLMSVIAVYPMLVLLLTFSKPLIGHLPQMLQVLMIVIILSILLTWPIMPMLSKILHPWLFAHIAR